MAVRRCFSQAGLSPFFHITKSAAKEKRARPARGGIDRDLDRALETAGNFFDREGLQRAHAGGGKVAGDAAHPGAIAAVGGQRDFDYRVEFLFCGGRL